MFFYDLLVIFIFLTSSTHSIYQSYSIFITFINIIMLISLFISCIQILLYLFYPSIPIILISYSISILLSVIYYLSYHSNAIMILNALFTSHLLYSYSLMSYVLINFEISILSLILTLNSNIPSFFYQISFLLSSKLHIHCICYIRQAVNVIHSLKTIGSISSI